MKGLTIIAVVSAVLAITGCPMLPEADVAGGVKALGETVKQRRAQ